MLAEAPSSPRLAELSPALVLVRELSAFALLICPLPKFDADGPDAALFKADAPGRTGKAFARLPMKFELPGISDPRLEDGEVDGVSPASVVPSVNWDGVLVAVPSVLPGEALKSPVGTPSLDPETIFEPVPSKPDVNPDPAVSAWFEELAAELMPPTKPPRPSADPALLMPVLGALLTVVEPVDEPCNRLPADPPRTLGSTALEPGVRRILGKRLPALGDNDPA